MKKLVLYYLFILFCNSSYSQYYFRGQVLDDKRKPVQNAKIYIHSLHTLYKSGTVGDFGINMPRLFDSVTVSLEGYETVTQPVKADKWTEFVLKMTSQTSNKNRPKLISVTKDFTQSQKFRWELGEETYYQQIENESVNAERFPNTGFSINVNKAAYSNMRRFINLGSTPPPDAVRIEELVNYFNLCYHEPQNKADFLIQSYVSNCPWSDENQLLFLNISAKKMDIHKVPPSNLVFLIDISGSMDMPNRLPLLKAAFQMLVKNLRDEDTVSIVTYGGFAGVQISGVSGAEKEKLTEVIEKLEAAGDTPGPSGIHLAYREAVRHFIKGGNNRVILATDGDFNVGKVTEKELDDLITIEKQSGVFLTCMGVGMGNYKDSKLETLAKKGNGNFAYIDDIKEAEKVLVKEFTQTIYTVAQNVFLNISFNKSRVKEYRLIGFDNKRDALGDTSLDMEGGDVGSGNNILAMFEIVPEKNIAENEKIGQLSLRYRPINDSIDRFIHYDVQGNSVDFKSLDRELRFGASVAMFGMRMRESKFAKKVTWDSVEDIAVASYNPGNYLQTEFIELLEKTKKICSVKKKRKDD